MSHSNCHFKTVDELHDLFTQTQETRHETLFRDVASKGFPLFCTEESRATFCIWESDVFAEGVPDDCRVHLWINRLTDKQFFSRGLMSRISNTQVWAIELDLPMTLMATYGFSVVPKSFYDASSSDRSGASSLAKAHHKLSRVPDPNARSGAARFTSDGQPVLSAFYGPSSPAAHAGWLIRNSAGNSDVRESSVACPDGHQRPIFTYFPPAELINSKKSALSNALSDSQALPVVFLLDADTWFRHIQFADILNWSIEHELIPPLCVTGAGSLNPSDRVQTFARVSESMDSSVLVHLFFAAMADAREYETNSEAINGISSKPIIAGQSLGGLGALQLDRHLARAGQDPRAVIISSPSVWWSPNGDVTPANLGEEEVDWAVREFVIGRDRSPSQAPLFIDAGAREGLLVSKSFQLFTAAASQGRESDFRIVDGGHDHAWWAYSLIERLGTLLNPSAACHITKHDSRVDGTGVR